MATLSQINQAHSRDATSLRGDIGSRERLKSLMLRAWIFAGLFFMALPGTLLGFSNLLAISAHHGLSNLPSAWIQGHGHAQVFGWIGSFVLGIGFYSQPTRERSALRIPLACFAFWTSGVAMRWAASIYGWHWRTLFAVSASFETIAILLFLAAASRHKLPDPAQEGQAKPRMELWMISVLLSTVGLLALVIFNLVECLRLAIDGTERALSPRIGSEVSRASCMGIPCARCVGIFRALVAHVPGDSEARRAHVSHCAHLRFGRRVVWRVGMGSAGDDSDVRERSCDRVRAASDRAPSRPGQSPGDSSELSSIHPACICMAGNCGSYEYLGGDSPISTEASGALLVTRSRLASPRPWSLLSGRASCRISPASIRSSASA